MFQLFMVYNFYWLGSLDVTVHFQTNVLHSIVDLLNVLKNPNGFL